MRDYRTSKAPVNSRFPIEQQYAETADPVIAAPERDPSLIIEVPRSVGTAPAGLTFRAKARNWGVGKHAEDLRYEWDFGDLESKPFDKIDRGTVLWGNNSNKAYLDCAAHTFHPSPGDFDAATSNSEPPATELPYTVTVTATDGVRVLQQRVTVTIRNPDHVFQGTNTVLCASDGDFTGAPVDPYGGTYATAMMPPKSSNGRRILLKRGDLFDLPERRGIFKTDASGTDAEQYGAWGVGKKPILRGYLADKATVFVCNKLAQHQEMTIWGLKIISTWDSRTETTVNLNRPWRGISCGGGARGHITIHDIEMDGVDKGVVNNGKANWIVVSDCRIWNFRDYGLFISDSHIFAALGTKVQRPPDARGGSVGSLRDRGEVNDHGPMRNSHPRTGANGFTLLSQTEFYSNAGWSGGNGYENHPQGGARRPSHQPGLRWNTGYNPDAVLRIDRGVFDGGNAPFNITGNKKVAPVDAIVDKVIGIGSGNTNGRLLNIEHVGVVVRNFLLFMPPLNADDSWELKPSDQLISVGDRKNDYSKLARAVRVYSGTVLDYTRHDRTLLHNNMTATHSELETGNILHHAPNYATPLNLGGSLEFIRLFAPLYPGLKWANRFKDNPSHKKSGVPDSLELDPSSGTRDRFEQDGVLISAISLPVPKSSIALNAKHVALDDILGNLRGPQPSAGAVEPGSRLPE